MARGSSTLTPVKGKPGLFHNAMTGKYTYIAEWREDNKYDTVGLDSGSQAAGTEKNFFRDLSNKYSDATNMTTARRLPAGEEMIIDRIWCSVRSAYGNNVALPADVKKILENGYVKFGQVKQTNITNSTDTGLYYISHDNVEDI